MVKRLTLFVVGIFLIGMYWSAFQAFGAASNPEAEEAYKKAEAAYKAKELDKASVLLLEALKKEPDNAVFRFIFARVLFEKGDYLAAKENFEIVSRSRPSSEKGAEYNSKLKTFKKKVKEMQETFNGEGTKKLTVYHQNQSSKEKIKLGVTIYQAFKLSPNLIYKNYDEVKNAVEIYEKALQSSFSGGEWLKGPMLQLAYLYEISNKKDKAAEVYMRTLDYVEDPNEEFVITHKFDYLNRSNKEKLLDTIESGQFTQKDLEEMMGSDSAKVTDEDKKKIEDMISDARERLENAESEEERESVLEEIKASIIEKQKRGELPGSDKLKEKLKKEGKTMEQYMKEKGF
jgi:tetratricopeptide (TPR) repeat protein